jgi:RNA polymerase sigma factor (sigma-70 family)
VDITMTEPPVHVDEVVDVGAGEFADFYRASYTDIARALAYALGDVEVAAEATDEAMARAYPRWSTLRHYDNPGGWVYRVGLNWARSLHRRLSRRLPFRATEHTEPPVSDPAVAEALRRLSTDHRDVVVCRLLLDWSVDVTADALGVRPGTVKSRLHKALRRLEADLDHLRIER